MRREKVFRMNTNRVEEKLLSCQTEITKIVITDFHEFVEPFRKTRFARSLAENSPLILESLRDLQCALIAAFRHRKVKGEGGRERGVR